jgi:hypothetical protein
MENIFNKRKTAITNIHNANSFELRKTRTANKQREKSRADFNHNPLASSPLYIWPNPIESKLEKEDKKGLLFFVPGADIILSRPKNLGIQIAEYQEYPSFSNSAY